MSADGAIRSVPLGAGLLLLAAIWIVPPFVAAAESWPFTTHMIRHMVLVAIAAPLLVFGLPALSKGLQISPLIAALVEFFAVWGWHLSVPHELASIHSVWFVFEQASFLIAGYAVWASALASRSALAGAGGLLLTTMHMTLLGALLTLAPRPLYDAICFGIEPLTDQQLGGMVMLAVGTPVYLLGGVWLVRRALDMADEVSPSLEEKPA